MFPKLGIFKVRPMSQSPVASSVAIPQTLIIRNFYLMSVSSEHPTDLLSAFGIF